MTKNNIFWAFQERLNLNYIRKGNYNGYHIGPTKLKTIAHKTLEAEIMKVFKLLPIITHGIHWILFFTCRTLLRKLL